MVREHDGDTRAGAGYLRRSGRRDGWGTTLKVGKKRPLTRARFDDFFRLLPTRADSERSWTVTREEIEARNYDLKAVNKAVNPNAKREQDMRTPDELLDLIEARRREVTEALAAPPAAHQR